MHLSLFTVGAWPFVITALMLSAYNVFMLRIHLPQRPLVAAAVVIAFFGVALAATGFILQLLGIGPDT